MRSREVGKRARARHSPARVVSVDSYLNFCARPNAAEKYYYESCRIAHLAYVSSPNAACPTEYERANTLPGAAVEQTLSAFRSEDPRTELPHQDHPWSDGTAFLGTKPNTANAEERDVALALKHDYSSGPHPHLDAIRILTWGIWEKGHLYTARLNTGPPPHVIFNQRPSAIIFRGLNQESVQILRKTQIRGASSFKGGGVPQ